MTEPNQKNKNKTNEQKTEERRKWETLSTQTITIVSASNYDRTQPKFLTTSVLQNEFMIDYDIIVLCPT